MKTEGEVTERNTPTPVISPRFRVRRLETGSYELVIYTQETISDKVITRQQYAVTSRAAQELFDEMVGAMAKEGA